MKATVIIDNIENDGIPGEWGLSIYIEHNDKVILLDTGKSELFADNANKLGLDLSKVDYAFISHAHYDHSNGMPLFFEKNKKAQFYLRESTGENCYKKVLFAKKYIDKIINNIFQCNALCRR